MKGPFPIAARLTSRRLSSSSAAAALDADVTPPASVYSIVTDAERSVADAGAAVRQMGTMRRVFPLKPYLTAEELEGLAYRIDLLSKNQGISSILIANDDEDDVANGARPSFFRDLSSEHVEVVNYKIYNEKNIRHIAGGYSPRAVYQSGVHKDNAKIQALLQGLQKLALAAKGDVETTRIPVITLPHGMVNDGGYALCMGSYVLATPASSFSISNPSRGLSLDPIGLSYILPRLGWEFHQRSADYPGIGMILALTGIKANGSDMVETGLATHYMESVGSLGSLEHSLSAIAPWNQLNLVWKHDRHYGDPESTEDENAPFRNLAVASALHAVTTYHADGEEMWGDSVDFSYGEDPSLDLDDFPTFEYRESHLVDYGDLFAHEFRREKSLGGLMERFREIASYEPMDRKKKRKVRVAKKFLKRMERVSPLALRAVHQLMRFGEQDGQTLEECMEREMRVQAKLFAMEDFENWAKFASNYKEGEEPPFTGWKHKSVNDVTIDEVEELLG